MAEQERSKGGKDSKKVKRARRHAHGAFVPRVHNKTNSLRRMIHKGQVFNEYKARGESPFLMPFDNYLCRMFAFMRAQGLPAPRG
jgi:hypothetical protein